MKVLITDFDLFAKVGGGQTFYRSLIRKNPDIDFYYLIDKEERVTKRPNNAHGVPFQEKYFLADLNNFFDVNPPKWVYRSFIRASNIAASVAGMEFDLVDSPDYEQWAIFLRPALDYHRVKFAKIALSLHGKISTTLKLDWFNQGKENIPLELEEWKQYATVDLRYGISKSYIDEWQSLSPFSAHYYHPLHFFELPQPLEAIASGDRPDLNFIGRTERRKGPDIFIDIAWWLNKNLYHEANIIGPHSFNDTGTISSETYLRSMLGDRQSPVKFLPPKPQGELMALFARKTVTFVPSRYDTLNLVALESLFSGCPTVIGGGAGVCRLLKEDFPDVPFVEIDLENIYSCLPAIEHILGDYSGYRRQLVDSVKNSAAIADSPVLADIYQQTSQYEQEIRDELKNWYAQLMGYWVSTQENVSFLQPLKAQLKPTLKQIKNNLKSTAGQLKGRVLQPLGDDRNAQLVKAPNLLKKYKETFNATEQTAKDLAEKIQMGWRLGSGYESEFQGVRGKLATNYRIDRVRLWRELARIEELRDHTLVSATYKLRAMRALGEDQFGDLPFVLRTLTEYGFPKEMAAVSALYGQPSEREERCHSLIEQARLDNLTNPAGDEYEIWDDRRGDGPYRATIIVSLYNAAAKLPLFLKTLQHQTLIKLGEAEVVLVDSGSPGNEYEVFKDLAPTLGYPLLYARSPQRETIQSAWNRGIKLAKSPYLAFLGVDETILPDCLEILAGELDQDPELDWAIGHSLVTNVDMQGGWASDIMPYDRTGYEQDLVYLETCYLSWVGALYRKSIHERFGYYDQSFRGAGDTEFKNRVMPFIKSKVVDKMLGLFWNYPDERTTQSPATEIEDMRAWYLHRTLAGVKYAFQRRSPEEVENLLYHCLGYRKSYCKHTSTDFDHAYNLALYLEKVNPHAEALQYAPGIKALLGTYRSLDWLPKLSKFSPLNSMLTTRKLTKQWEQEHQQHWPKDRLFSPHYSIFNDNRHEQHSFLWFTDITASKK
ncbi:glycosyltransferase [Synechocystis sp. PCC 7339]|uniref:glycosyltransferase n=1 Tax=unclassified Synechocystis TaxID=2640012 RepID=UPI001BAF42F7|nr:MULTISPECIES: glycosyltransferase [unclassified Synechocystis]QUS62002.1 glycosyltransferase [Synechocystis sp. PCC 7338]UAJ74199.1 glycosyltransferase [Synechocystis sp. PCC 7339]